ncbi:hypothetical protein Taro_048173 [Colocasia esculenta]|uniref:Pentatricopeptide repeat-containing protein n=1 Tax=Colocasia esculenta TaxID=4460 RepID=A0A843X682_COLES|nr:hypothetical protein [Colocasia esculenta]
MAGRRRLGLLKLEPAKTTELPRGAVQVAHGRCTETSFHATSQGRTMLALALSPPVSNPKHQTYQPCASGPSWSGAAAVSPISVSPPLPRPAPANGHGRRQPFQVSIFLPRKTSRETASPWLLPASASAHEEISRVSRLRLRQMIESNKIDDAKKLHGRMRSEGVEFGVVLESVLINAFMKSGRAVDAFRLFEEMPERNVVIWTSMISGCTQNGNPEKGFLLFVEMVASGVLPNDFSFSATLQACANLTVLDHGHQVHSLIIRSGFEGDARIGICLINFYSSCGLIDEAVLVFDRMSEQDVVSFTSLITGFCKNNMFESAVGAFLDMARCGVEPNEHTIATVLTASTTLLLGVQMHGYMVKVGFEKSLHCSCALIELYSRHKAFTQAQLVFSKLEMKSVVTWSSMISCCIRNGQADNALRMFREMICSDVKPNEFTFATVISACGLCLELLGVGRQVHCFILKLGMLTDDRIRNALITMYARNGEIDASEMLFDKFEDPDVVTWSAVISGYFQNGYYEKSANFLCEMHRKGYKPNEFGFSSAMSACAHLALLDQGRQFHSLVLKLGCDPHACIGNALINMYAKCGCIEDARLAFDVMPIHDVMSWNSLFHGYAQFGQGMATLKVFDRVVKAGKVMPDESTFLAVLVACSHTGHVDKALEYLKSMEGNYGVMPTLSHYACIVDMMGRAGRLLEAVQIINEMPLEPDCLIWKTLLGSCRLHENLELGKLVARKVIELSPEDSASYVLLSSLYAMHGKWDDAKSVRQMMEERGVKKDAAWSWIEISNMVHAFVSTDRSHPRTEHIYKSLEELMKQMKDEGYSPDLASAAYDQFGLIMGMRDVYDRFYYRNAGFIAHTSVSPLSIPVDLGSGHHNQRHHLGMNRPYEIGR